MYKRQVSVFVFIFVFFPILYLFVSFLFPNFQLSGIGTVINYVRMSYDPRILSIFIRTLFIGFAVSLLTAVIGTTLSILIDCTNISHKNFFKFSLFLPFLIPAYIFTFSWMAFLGKRGIFANIQMPNIPIDIYNPYGVIFFLTLSLFPITMLAVSLGIKNINKDLIDVGRLAKSKKILKNILLPLIKPHIMVSSFIVFALAISEYTVPAFLRVNTYSGEIFAQMAAFYNLNRAVLYSVPMLLLSFTVSVVIYFYIKRNPVFTVSSSFKEERAFINLSKRQKFITYTFLTTMILISVAIPIGMILIESEASLFDAVLFARESVINSIILASLSSILITFVGFLVYNVLKENQFLPPLITIPLIIPAPVMGVALINLYNSFSVGVYGTEIMLLLGYMIRFLPFSILMFMVFSRQVSPEIEEAGLLAERDYIKIMHRITLPLSKGGIISSMFIVFVLSFAEIGITQLLSPPGFQTLSIRIETLMHYGNYPFVASLSLFTILFILLVYLLYILGHKYERN